ncbi:hypothetical protein DFH09DRAFT_336542 [Mycena vulgaris]|nr:hypothetical protein DFH09DRAFT_336542 [Mycena vulgaris]
MRPAKMRRYVNDFLLPELKVDKTICESTAVQWLKKMGFALCRVQKGVYVDGHERKDVVESREKLIEHLWLKVLPFCYQYEGEPGETLAEIAPVLQDGEKIHYPIAHDECCVHANDQANFEWIRDGEQPLRQKSRGRLVHVSSFILEHCGVLSLTPEEIAIQLTLPKEPLPPSELPTPSVYGAAPQPPDSTASPLNTAILATHSPDPVASSSIAPIPEKPGLAARRASTRVSKRRHLPDQGYVSSDDEELPDLLPMEDSDFEDLPETPSAPQPAPAKKAKKGKKKAAAPAKKGPYICRERMGSAPASCAVHGISDS